MENNNNKNKNSSNCQYSTDEKYRQAMEQFERMRVKGEYRRVRDDEEAKRRRNDLYGLGGRTYYDRRRSEEEDIETFINALPALLGALFGVAIAYMLKVHDFGVYAILASIGYYGGVFVKHNAFNGEDPVTSFRSCMTSLYVAMAGVILGFISLFK